MKILSLLLPLSFLALVSLGAQEPPAPPTNAVPPPPPAPGTSPAPAATAPGTPGRGAMGNLSEAEKAQVKAAHDKAIQQDPSLEQRMKEARQALDAAKKAMHDAMVRADPSVEPILVKMTPPPKPPAPNPQAPGSAPSPVPAPAPVLSPGKAILPPHPSVPGLVNLTEEERARLQSLHEQVKNDPSVNSARELLRTASSPSERSAAEQALHKARRDAMLKADPSAEALLSKLGSGTSSPGLPVPGGSPMP